LLILPLFSLQIFGVSHRSKSCEIRLIFASISNFASEAKVRAHPRFNCKWLFQCLAFSKLFKDFQNIDPLTGWRMGGESIFWKTMDSGHCSVLDICKYFVIHSNVVVKVTLMCLWLNLGTFSLHDYLLEPDYTSSFSPCIFNINNLAIFFINYSILPVCDSIV
jgi:hypothetical protein